MSQKIQVKFYPLTSEITTMLRKSKLTAAEWRIWSYLTEIDPFGDRYHDIDSLDVMSKCDCSRATFYRAIAKFQKLGLFDFQDKGFSVRNLTGASTLTSDDEQPNRKKSSKRGFKNQTATVSKLQTNSQNCESSLKNETAISKMRLDSQKCDNQPPEPLPDKASGSPKTLKTYRDFKKTLSEGERENFFSFVKDQIRNLEKPINDLEAWLASKTKAKENRWEIYYRNYQGQATKQKSKTRNNQEVESTYTRAEKLAAIARFKAERNRNLPNLDRDSSQNPAQNLENQQNGQ